MKICIISRNYPFKICGVGDYTYWLANNLIDKFDIYVIIENMKNRLDYEKIKILSLNKWNFFSIFNAIKKISPDIVNIQYVCQLYGRAGIALYIAVLPIIIKIILKSKIVVTFHELQIKWRGRDFILGAIQRLQTFLLLSFSDAIIVTNERRADWLKFYCHCKKIYKIPVGSNILPTKDCFVSKEKKQKIILSTFGTLHPERDFLTVLEAISTIDDVEYWIIGKIDKNSYEFNKLIKKVKELKIEDKIKWIINASPEEVVRCLLNTDIYISPEIGGPSGRRGTLVAGFCFGLPIIAYDGYEKDSIFIDNKNIILVKQGDKKMLAKKINFLIKNKNMRIKLIENAKKTYNNYFDWQIISNKYEKIFNSITK